MTDKKPKRLCFVVGPIGDDESDDRIHADWLLEEIILPVFTEHFTDFEVKRADKISNPGRIDAQVITALLDAELVIADLTTLNPNAFYEIGIRHTIQKPVIHMHLEGQRIPFDIASFRSIKFQRRWPKDLRMARETLREFVVEAINPNHVVDNPVKFTRGRAEFTQHASPKDLVLLQEIEALKQRLDMFEVVGLARSFDENSLRRWQSRRNSESNARSLKVTIEPSSSMSDEELRRRVFDHIAPLLPYVSSETGGGGNIEYVIPPGSMTLKLDAELTRAADAAGVRIVMSEKVPR